MFDVFHVFYSISEIHIEVKFCTAVPHTLNKINLKLVTGQWQGKKKRQNKE